MSRLYNYCLLRWQSGAWTEVELQQAVDKGYITAEEKTQIMQTPQQ